MKPVIFLLCSSLALCAQAPKRPRVTGIAHVALGVSSLESAQRFYTGLLGFEEAFRLKNPGGAPRLVFFKISDSQFLELFPVRNAKTDLLLHFALETDDAKGMAAWLAAHGVPAPPPQAVRKGRTGNWNFIIDDPDKHAVEIMQYSPGSEALRSRGKFLGARRISTRLRHVGILAGNVEASMRFYRDILGFRETWRGSSSGKELSWITLKVPEGEDYIELMLYKDLPAPDLRGTFHHVCLEVPDAGKALAALEASPERKSHTRPIESRVGTNRRRQVNLFDPDGTRVELMEPGTVDGKPAPSSTAPPPGK